MYLYTSYIEKSKEINNVKNHENMQSKRLGERTTINERNYLP